MLELLSFFVLLSAGLIFSEVFKRLHLPYVIALIIAGIIVGPVFHIIEVDPTISLMGAIGVVFLMFIAGSEVKLKALDRLKDEVFILALFNSLIPFVTGFTIAWAFGYGLFTSLAMGAVFISSSIAVIIPSLEKWNCLKSKLGRTIIAATIFEDAGSLIVLAILLQSFTSKSSIPLVVFAPLLILLLVAMKYILPRIEKKFHARKKGKDLFQSELRFIFATLLATVVLFELMGIHAIIAGFIIGLLLSDSIRGKIEDKIKTVSYGFFIPIFFVVLGMQTDLSVFYSPTSLLLIATVVIGLLASKIFSGYIAGRLIKFSKEESLLIGVASTPQLSTTIAAAFAALEFGLLTQELISALIVLTIVTVFFSPMAIKHVIKKENIDFK